MNFVNVEYVSQKLKRKTNFKVILPEQMPAQKILLLLHGRGDNFESWMNYTNVSRYNKDHLIIMPSGDISFYVNREYGERFQDYLMELLDYVTAKFNVSDPKYGVAGNSMGGYGSLILALKYPNKFEEIGLFSPALVKFGDDYVKEHPDMMLNDNMKDIDLEKNLDMIADKIYLYCGKNDYLYPKVIDFAERNNLDIDIDDYSHEWDAWDNCIRKFLRRENGKVQKCR